MLQKFVYIENISNLSKQTETKKKTSNKKHFFLVFYSLTYSESFIF